MSVKSIADCTIRTQQIGRCKACIRQLDNVSLYLLRKDYNNIQQVQYDSNEYTIYALQSYQSIVCIAVLDGCSATYYHLPRSNFSNTTQRHISKFHDCIRELYEHRYISRGATYTAYGYALDTCEFCTFETLNYKAH